MTVAETEAIDWHVKRAIEAERERCAKICDAADKFANPADLADAIRKPKQEEGAAMGSPRQEVLIDYTNYRGERATRRIRPLSVAFENSEWHRETQWILHALDIERSVTREFAMQYIHSWTPSPRAV